MSSDASFTIRRRGAAATDVTRTRRPFFGHFFGRRASGIARASEASEPNEASEDEEDADEPTTGVTPVTNQVDALKLSSTFDVAVIVSALGAFAALLYSGDHSVPTLKSFLVDFKDFGAVAACVTGLRLPAAFDLMGSNFDAALKYTWREFGFGDGKDLGEKFVQLIFAPLFIPIAMPLVLINWTWRCFWDGGRLIGAPALLAFAVLRFLERENPDLAATAMKVVRFGALGTLTLIVGVFVLEIIKAKMLDDR